MEISPQRVNVHQLLTATVRINLESAAKKGIKIETKIDEDGAVLWADERAVRQILINLISNAIKFTPNGGSITISSAASEDGGTDIAVVDTGIGISADQLPKLMRPFEQVDNRYTRSSGGTGLGLALVKGLVERHSGSVTIDSKFGYGTTVTVRFPPHYAVHTSD